MLLDKSSAAVLQIDLGVAFEQGMFLNTPETVGAPGARRGAIDRPVCALITQSCVRGFVSPHGLQ